MIQQLDIISKTMKIMDQRIATVENQVTEVYDIHKQKKRDYYKSLPKTYSAADNAYKSSMNPISQEEYLNNQNYRQVNYSVSNDNNDNNQNYIENNYSNLNNSKRNVILFF